MTKLEVSQAEANSADPKSFCVQPLSNPWRKTNTANNTVTGKFRLHRACGSESRVACRAALEKKDMNISRGAHVFLRDLPTLVFVWGCLGWVRSAHTFVPPHPYSQDPSKEPARQCSPGTLLIVATCVMLTEVPFLSPRQTMRLEQEHRGGFADGHPWTV